MIRTVHQSMRHLAAVVFSLMLLAFVASPVLAGEYAALNGVKGLNSVFDFSLGSPTMATIVFPAIIGAYQDKNVTALPDAPHTAIVFHGAAVKLISTERAGFNEEETKALDKLAEIIRQLKKDGATLEVCMYAVKVMGVNPDSILPEIDKVGNGFISVLGYQAQGYSVVTVN